MADSTGLQTQLEELAVKLTSQVAELLAVAAKTLEDGEKRQKILEMIEGDLPTVIVNTLYKTTALHSPGGIDHLRANLDDYATQFSKSFLRND